VLCHGVGITTAAIRGSSQNTQMNNMMPSFFERPKIQAIHEE
jgi:hypothetical protein